jgi:hypothetical protein
LLRGKLERWAPTTARGMVVLVVGLVALSVMVEWIESLVGVWGGLVQFFGKCRGVLRLISYTKSRGPNTRRR